MSRLLSLVPRVRTLQYVLIAVVAFSLGGATVVQAVAPGGIAGVVQLADRTDNTRLAAVDASGNVSVAAAQAGAWSVRDVDAPALSPVTLRGSIFCGGEAICHTVLQTSVGPYSVPAGKRLVIELVSARVLLSDLDEVAYITLATGAPGFAVVHLAPQPRSIESDGRRSWVAMSLVRMYVEPGAQVTMTAVKLLSITTWSGSYTAIGYLQDIP